MRGRAAPPHPRIYRVPPHGGKTLCLIAHVSVSHKLNCHLTARQTVTVDTTSVKLRNAIELKNRPYHGFRRHLDG